MNLADARAFLCALRYPTAENLSEISSLESLTLPPPSCSSYTAKVISSSSTVVGKCSFSTAAIKVSKSAFDID